MKKTAKKPAVKKKKVLAIPRGYHSVTPYLVISGEAAAALEFYKKAFKAKEKMRLQMPNKQIMHAELIISKNYQQDLAFHPLCLFRQRPPIVTT
jgi:hypothetical protein